MGIVVANDIENSFSILCTYFGLAKLYNYVSYGTWMRITMEEDSLNEHHFPISLEVTNKCFIVEKSDKILPLMSTRVINIKNEEKILV